MENAQNRIELLADEWDLLVGLTSALVGLDDRFSEQEETAMRAVLEQFVVVDSVSDSVPYRTNAGPVQGATERLENAFARTDALYPTRDALLDAAGKLHRTAAKEALYGALFEIAAVDYIAPRESAMLEWLRQRWGIAVISTETGEELT